MESPVSRSAQPFGRYELLERISAGGMAEVFRARDTSRDLIVALKRILPQIAEDEEFVQMFEDEAQIASQLEHPHIARTLDFGRIGDSYYIAFEYVNGRDLRSLFDRCVRSGEKPPLSFLLYVFARIGEGLAYAHARKDPSGAPVSIVHRDVSPQNIIVSFDGDVKLIDFGIAKAAGKLSRTQVGTLKGKFGYMAPEQIRGTEIDSRVDLFSMGICMWELLTGERLFNAENELLVLEKVRSATIAPPSTKNRDVPPELDRVVLKALAKDVRERYRSAKDLYRDLDRLAQTIGATASREQIARYMRSTFPESSAHNPALSELGPVLSNGARPPPAHNAPSIMDQQETSNMAADTPSSDSKARGASDLDIFEGLGKKTSNPAPSRAPSAPPPPPRSATTPPMIIKSDVAKRTLVGMAPGGGNATGAAPGATTAPAPQPAPRVLPPPSRSAPPPPPGRSSLPHVVPPPPRASVTPPPLGAPTAGTPGMPSVPPPPAAMTMPGGVAMPSVPVRGSTAPAATPATPANAKSGGLDMDWDDEDEATHVFDKPGHAEEADAQRAPRPAAGTPLAPPVGAGAVGKSTLLGIASPFNAPPPAPPARVSAPPPPPSPRGGGTGAPPPSLNAFARPSSAVPPPPSFPVPRGPADDAPTMPRPTTSVPPPPTGMPHQVSTAPLPMPGRVPNAQARVNGYGDQPALPPVSSMSSPAVPNRMEATQLVRQPTSRVGLIGTVVAVAAVVAVLVILVMPHTGRIAVNVTDSKGAGINHVEIFVDGKKQCDTAPCIVDQVSSGSHDVKVLAQGYDAPTDKSVTVEARKDSQLDFSLGATSAKAGTGIKVAGSQPGVKLYVDGKEIGPMPEELHNLTPGDHKIRLAGTDRYAPIEKSIILAQDEVQDLGEQTLKVVKGKATIELDTPGAKVSIVSGNDRREFPTLPIAVDLDTSKSWALEASKPGFTDYRQTISFDDGVAEKTFKIALEPKSSAVAMAAPQGAPPAAAAAPPRAVAAAPHPVKEPAPAADTSSSDTADGESYLNINSLPASSVVLDGKPLGSTPKVHVQVTAGSHTVVFTNADQGLKKQITVTVGAGETKAAIARLRD
jgi:serine/threonine protein kinase